MCVNYRSSWIINLLELQIFTFYSFFRAGIFYLAIQTHSSPYLLWSLSWIIDRLLFLLLSSFFSGGGGQGSLPMGNTSRRLEEGSVRSEYLLLSFMRSPRTGCSLESWLLTSQLSSLYSLSRFPELSLPRFIQD